MLESVMIIRLATGAMVEVVVPFGFSKAGFLSGCPVELGVVAASKEGTEDAEFHAGVGAYHIICGVLFFAFPPR